MTQLLAVVSGSLPANNDTRPLNHTQGRPSVMSPIDGFCTTGRYAPALASHTAPSGELPATLSHEADRMVRLVGGFRVPTRSTTRDLSILAGYSSLGTQVPDLTENEGIVMELPAHSRCVRSVHVSRHAVRIGIQDHSGGEEQRVTYGGPGEAGVYRVRYTTEAFCPEVDSWSWWKRQEGTILRSLTVCLLAGQ